MRHTIPFVLAAAMLASCDLPPVEVPFDGEVQVPGCELGAACQVLDALPEIPGVSDFDVTSSGEFSGAGGAIDQIDGVTLSRLDVMITGGAESFAWLDSISFYAGSTDGSQPEVKLAELTLGTAEKGSRQISLKTTGENIAEHVKNQVLVISSKANGSPPSVDTDLAIDGAFEVTFKASF